MMHIFTAPADIKTQTIEIPHLPAIEMIHVQGSTYMMGGKSDNDNSKPIHPVKLTDFWIGKYPVTQALWQAVMGENPAYQQSPTRPVERVSWYDCQAFLTKLNTLSPHIFALPTEAQWEYAARGGKHDEGYVYAGSNDLHAVAWYSENTHYETKPVGLKMPNQLGIYDMTGNVIEWCEDYYEKNFYQKCVDENIINDAKLVIGELAGRVFRGGAYFSPSQACALRNRNLSDAAADRSPGIGLRVVFSAQK